MIKKINTTILGEHGFIDIFVDDNGIALFTDRNSEQILFELSVTDFGKIYKELDDTYAKLWWEEEKKK
jgi:hypothetical protein